MNDNHPYKQGEEMKKIRPWMWIAAGIALFAIGTIFRVLG